MSKKNIGIAVIVLGVALVTVSLAADLIGLGVAPVVGWKQMLGAAIGVIAALGGVWLMLQKPGQKE